MEKEKSEKTPMTPERRAAWAKSTDEKFEKYISELAESGAFQKLEACKDNIKAPVLILPGAYEYSFYEKSLPLIAEMGKLGCFEDKNKDFSNHLFVTRYAVDHGDTKEIHPSKGSHYIDLNIRRKIENEVVDSPTKVIPMWSLSGKFTDKVKKFLIKKDGYTKNIPYDTYGTRIARMVDYASITKEAIEKDGAKNVISKAWGDAKERLAEVIEKTQPEYDKRMEAIKQTDLTTRPPKGQEFLLYLKRAYDSVPQKTGFPTSITFMASKDALLAGASVEAVRKAVATFSPGAARDTENFHYADNIMKAIALDYRFQKQFREKEALKQQNAR